MNFLEACLGLAGADLRYESFDFFDSAFDRNLIAWRLRGLLATGIRTFAERPFQSLSFSFSSDLAAILMVAGPSYAVSR